MKNESQTVSNKRNIATFSGYSTVFTVLGLAAVILSAAYLLVNNGATIQDSPVIADLPNLQGDAAIIHLKQNGTFDSLAEAVTAARYRVEAVETGATANNEANDLQINFTADGWQLKSTAKNKNWSSNWRLSSFGYGTNQTAAANGSWQTAENRVELRRVNQPITEWFVNQPNGVEHGFTLAARPRLENNGEALRLVMAIDGDLTMQADENGQALTLIESDGAKALRYEKLKVWDADGKDLTARMRTERGGEVWFEVEDAAAVYPITIDPTFVEIQKLTATGSNGFAISLAISGETAIVGSSGDNIDFIAQGSAYVFVRNGTTWTLQQRLTASDGARFDLFGRDVAISADTVVVGAPSNFIGANQGRGSAYIFVRSGTTWTEQQKLSASDGAACRGIIGDEIFCDNFGSAVTISGETAIIGADGDDINFAGQGSAYVFVRNGITWTEQQKLIASDGFQGDGFGNDVVILGNTTIIGSPGSDIGTPFNQQGAAYVFVRSGTTWMLQQKLTASDGTGGDNLGRSVSISGETTIIGASGDKIGANFEQGSAYIFVRSGTTWTEQQKLTASDGAERDRFGDSVAISGDTVVIGVAEDDIGTNQRQGSAYIFVRNGTNWTEQQKLTASDGGQNDIFGRSAAISGNTAVIGALGDNNSQGSAYVFQPNSTPTPTPTPTSTPTVTPTPTATPTPGGNACTPTTTVTEGDLAPGGIVSFGISSGFGSVTVDHVNAGTGLQSLTVVGTPTNATVNIPPFTPGTFNPVTVTFTTPMAGQAVDFTLRAASRFHAAFIRVRCAETCTPTTTVTEGDLAPGGIVSFGISSGAGSVTVDHVNAGTGLQSLTVMGTPVNAVVNIPPFTPGTFNPVTVTFLVINPNQPVDFTLRAASRFHAANIRVRCGTPPNQPKK